MKSTFFSQVSHRMYLSARQVITSVYFDHEIGRPEDDKDGRAIDHVGVISKIKGNTIWFVHASGGQKCTVNRYEKNKKKYERNILSARECVVKEVKLTNKYWKPRLSALGRLKDYQY